eukprot:10422215-Prorocentrum_lima.AAC.1
MLNAVTCIWMRYVETQATQVAIRSYVDDVSFTTTGGSTHDRKNQLAAALTASLHYVHMVGGKLDLGDGKSFTFGD